MSSLYDERNGLIYVPMSLELYNQLRYGWGEPVQVRVDANEQLVFRALRQAGRLYAVDEPERGAVS